MRQQAIPCPIFSLTANEKQRQSGEIIVREAWRAKQSVHHFRLLEQLGACDASEDRRHFAGGVSGIGELEQEIRFGFRHGSSRYGRSLGLRAAKRMRKVSASSCAPRR